MTLTTLDFNKWLDMPSWRGQRVDRFRFEWLNGITNQTLGYLTPARDSQPPSLAHDTTQSTKRKLTIALGVADTANIDPITDRVQPWAIIGGTTYPLGRYMFTDDTRAGSSGGDRGTFTLLDEGFAIDQQLDSAFSSTATVDAAITTLVAQVSFIKMKLAPTTFFATGAFPAGQTRGQALEAYATQGDYFPYWMDNDGFFRIIRTIDPGTAIPDFDYDANHVVVRNSASLTSDILRAPNRFVVIGNSTEAGQTPLVGTYDVPPTAPHSVANRGFVVPSVQSMQLQSQDQATAMATNLGIRQTIFERTQFQTMFDPRHDSYNIIHYQGENWLELSWAATLVPGAPMNHLVRKAYR